MTKEKKEDMVKKQQAKKESRRRKQIRKIKKQISRIWDKE
jgi:hypothetical protein